MIRYPVSPQELEDGVRVRCPGWLERASQRTGRFRHLGCYEEASSIWSEVKPVFMALQHEKCAYCERRLAGGRFGAIEHDVEHYRPKAAVEAWPTAKISEERGISYSFQTGGDLPGGYYLLAYHILNYAIACKTCNSPLKANFFPVGAARIAGNDSPAALAAEMPFLLFPIGDLDEDPEEILTFDGLNPVPRVGQGHRRNRAVVTIDFFALAEREELLRGRAEKIRDLFLALDRSQDRDPAMRDFANRAVISLLSSASEHANCARAFYRLFHGDRPRAAALAQSAQSYLDSQS